MAFPSPSAPAAHPFNPEYIERGPYFPHIDPFSTRVIDESGHPKNSPARKLACLAIGVALIGLAVLAAYAGMSQGWTMLDWAYTGSEIFLGGAVFTLGVISACVALGNLAYTGSKLSRDDSRYTAKNAMIQMALGAAAPMAISIPLFI